MAVNATEVLYLTSGLFKAVPSKAVLTDLVKFNGNIEGLAASLGTSPYAVNAFPFSNAEKAKTLAENLLGSSVSADAKAAATTALEGVLNANGGNVGIAAVVAIKEILKGGTYADAKAQLENRVKVAAAYVDSNKGNEISTSVLDAVTKDAATVTTAINSLSGTTGGNEAGADRVLTTAQDILTGTAGNDNFRAVAGANFGAQDQTTLNSSDIIDGAAGNDTLIVNLVNGGAAANYGGGARLKNIETLKLGTNNSATFDYNVNQGQNEITDVTTIVADQINTGETLTINNLVRDAADKALPTLSWINDSTAINGLAGTVAVNYRAAAVSGTADEQAVSLTNVRAGTLNLAAGVEKVTLTSAGTATNSIDKVQSGITLTDVVIKADAQLGGNREVSAVAATAGMEINRTALNTNDKHLSFVNMGSSVKNVTAEGSKAAVHVAFTDTATDNTFKGGDGNDVVILNGGNDKFEGGKGDDTVIFRQTSTSSNGSFFNNSDTLDGGEGKDTILIDYAKDSTSSLNQVVIQTSEWLNSKGLDVLDLRATNTRTVLEDAFVGRADAGSFEVVTNKIVQNDSTSSVADEANSTHQIDLTNVSATRNIKVTGGEGRETVIVTDALNGTSTLSGGNGLDTLVVQNGATLTGQDLQNVTGFNTINLVKTGTTAQTFNIDLTADFLTKAVDSNVNAGTTKNTSNAFAIVTDAQDGARNTMNGVQTLAAGDVVNVTVDVTGLNNLNAVDLRDIVNAGATLVVRNTSGTVLFSNQAGNVVAGTGVWAGLNGGGAAVAYNAATTPIVGAGTPVASGQTSGNGSSPSYSLTQTKSGILTSSLNTVDATGTAFLTSGNDTINSSTFLAGSTIVDSSSTDSDSLTALLTSAVSNATTVRGIESLTFDSYGGSVDFTNVTGQTSTTIKGLSFTATKVAAAQTFTLSGVNGAQSFNLADEAGGSDALTLNLAGTTSGAALTYAGDALETLNLNVTSASTITVTDLDSASNSAVAVNISGAALTVTDNSGDTGTWNASAATGALSYTQGKDVARGLVGTAGNDSFTFGGTAGTLTNADTINGGAGVDTLSFVDAGATDDLNSVTNVEVIKVLDGANASVTTVQALVAFGQTLTVDASALTSTYTLTWTGSNETDGMFSVTGGAGNDTIVGGSGPDTINGGAGNDSITGGNGGDIINVGTGTDTVVFGAAGQTFNAAVTSGTTVLAGVDVISGMAAGDVLSVFSAAGITTATTVGTALMSAGSSNAAAIVKGNYNSVTGIFTTSTSGTDSLVQWDADGTGTAGAVESVVLVGFTGTLTATANTFTLA